MSKQIAPYQTAILNAREKFESAKSVLQYDAESVFAMQAVTKTDFATKIANQNPTSVALAMRNVAATGLTLNPAQGYAYLVPRDGSIMLDISYKGLIKIATDAGAIAWARADVVHERDSFVYHGPAKAPTHTADVFAKDRGEIIGAYCIAKTRDGDILCEVIGRVELDQIRGKSDLYARKKSGPWVEWYSQMCKKAVVKRAAKTWPYSAGIERLLDAVEIANASEGGYTLEGEAVELVNDKQLAKLRALVPDAAEQKALVALYGVDALEALPAARFAEVVATVEARNANR